MFSSPRRHPLHSFRFWFLVLGAVAVTVAWRLDLLPFEVGPPNTGSLANNEFVEVDLSKPTPWDGSEGGRDESDAPFFGDDGAEVSAAAAFPGELSPAGEPTQTTSPLAFPTDRATTAQQMPASSSAVDADSSGQPGPTDDGAVRVASAQNPFAERQTHRVEPAVAETSVPAYDFSRIDQLLQSARAEDDIEAHRELSTLYWQRPELRPQMQERIDRLARKVYFMPQPHYMDAYTIQPGDLLQNVAKDYNVSWQYLAKLNRVDPQQVRPGQELKVIKGPFSAIVDLSDYELTVHAHGYYVAKFPVGIGKDGSTPLGEITVQEKLVDPTYYGPDGIIAHDDPNNPLGERWIDLGNSYGIHGTIDPDSIGRSESRGCIRLHNADVAVLYDLLTIGSPVEIRE